MFFKYWIEFDEDGEIKSFYKSKNECESPCREYIVKLIPIDRSKGKLSENIDKTTKAAEDLAKNIRKLDTEINKASKELRRLRI